jgi:hypothetical protein
MCTAARAYGRGWPGRSVQFRYVHFISSISFFCFCFLFFYLGKTLEITIQLNLKTKTCKLDGEIPFPPEIKYTKIFYALWLYSYSCIFYI